MIKCSKCGRELEDNAKFCVQCGAPVADSDTAAIVCQHCGGKTPAGSAFCQNCGAALSGESDLTVPPVGEDDPPAKKSVFSRLPLKLSKKVMAIGGSCLAVVLIAAIVLSVVLTGGKNDFALYLKDGEMYSAGISKGDPWQVTQRLVNDPDSDMDGLDFEYAADWIFLDITYLPESGILFFGDEYDDMGVTSSYSLFFRYVDAPDRQPVKIDSNVTRYAVNVSGTCVTYMKGDENALYQSNLTDKEKIDSEVQIFGVSADGANLVYLTEDGDLYLRYGDADKEKIDSDVSEICDVSKDYSTVYYIKNNSLYQKAVGSEKVKIADNVDSVLQVFETGEIYYLKAEDQAQTLYDYVEDDLRQADAALEEPQAPDYPSIFDYDSVEEYNAAYEKYDADYDKYWDALRDYNEKEERDELRKELAAEPLDEELYTLCYYDGKTEKQLAEHFVFYSDYIAESKPVMAYQTYDLAAVSKVKISEMESLSDAEDMVESALSSTEKFYVAAKDNISAIDVDSVLHIAVEKNGENIYFLGESSADEEKNDLYRLAVEDGKVQSPEVYDSGVSNFLLIYDNVVCVKDTDDVIYKAGDLYINKELVDYDVAIYRIKGMDDGTVVYFTDYDTDEECGTLKCFKNGKSQKIADDVHTFDILSGDEILYLCNYDNDDYEGELFAYRNGKAKKLDDGVTAIVPYLQ